MKYYKNPKKRFVYLKQYKVGCSTIEQIFKSSNLKLRGFNSTPNDLQVKYKGWFKFGIVRNPFDRVVSLYCDKCQKNAQDRINRGDRKLQNCQKVILRALNKPLEVEQLRTITFPQFVSILPVIKNRDLHFNAQSPLFINSNGKFIADQLVRFENMNQELPNVLTKLGLNKENIPHVNATSHEDYRKYYTETEILTVQIQYGEDLKNFNYQF